MTPSYIRAALRVLYGDINGDPMLAFTASGSAWAQSTLAAYLLGDAIARSFVNEAAAMAVAVIFQPQQETT